MKQSVRTVFKGMLGVALLAITVGLPAEVWGAPVSATGGDEVYDIMVQGDIPYRVHVFTNTESATLTVSNGGAVDYLMVGGGGGGGGKSMGGGGGAGGLISSNNIILAEGVYSVTVGVGGAGGSGGNVRGSNGVDTLFGSITATGGGGGGSWNTVPTSAGLPGGSGGGASGYSAVYGTASPAGQGNNGGPGASHGGGGGGGAGAAGGKGTSQNGGTGGDGVASFLSGVEEFYAGGGGGAGYQGTEGAGGIGGGGAGAPYQGAPTAGTPGTGGGGGGANGYGTVAAGAGGGSGIVLVRYSLADFCTALEPFTLADIETGNERFTYSNAVDIATLPVPGGYDRFQCTGETNTVAAINPSGWQTMDKIPDLLANPVTFSIPSTATNITLYVWFTNTTDTAKPLLRSPGQINYVTDVSDSVLEFFAPASFVNLGKPAVLQLPLNHPLTVEGWVRFKSFSAEDMLYSKNNSRTGSGYTHMFGLRDSGKTFSAYTGGLGSPVNTWIDIPLPEALEIERWYHLAFAYDGTDLSGYVDGKKIGATKFSYGNYAAHTVTIGGQTDVADVDALRSDVRLWDFARSEKDIARYRGRRLSGSEPGLVGYWPLNDWSGTKVFDRTAHASTGTIVKARSTFSEGFSLAAPPQGFALASAFTLADRDTGSERFTNSNEVDVITFALPVGVDGYQVTQNGELSGIDTHGWNSTNTLPAQLSFTTPDTDTNIIFYAWFTNSVTGSGLLRAEGHIFFTRVQPVPSVRDTLTREILPGSNVVIYASDLDVGSTGGFANETVLGFVQQVALAANPNDDLTPDEPYVTLSAAGDYPLLLWLKNEAGNTVTSAATCLVSVVSYSGTNVWKGGGVSDEWHDGVNWGAGVPIEGQDVIINSGNLRLTAATAKLRSFTLAQGATLTIEGWESTLNADEIVVAGTIKHAAQTVAINDFINAGEWVPQHRIWLKGTNFTLTSSGKLDADEKGYGIMCGPGSGSTSRSGAGYGGDGGAGFRGTKGGPSYGTPEDPWQPGSGGNNGAGGGAIRIEMSNAVVINGTATACGADRTSTHQTGGSGGGITIHCKTFQGTSTGLIKVDGGRGYYYGGNSGGGRIALHYDPTAQAALSGSRPAVRFSAYANQEIARPSDQNERTMVAQMGTLYLSDVALLAEAPEGDVILSDQRFWYTRLYFASHPKSWSPASLTMTNCVIGFRGGSTYDTGVYEGFDLNVAGDLTLITVTNAPQLMMGYFIESGLYLYAARTNELYGARLRVGGNLTIGPNSALYPWTSGHSGAIVGVRVAQNVTVAAGGRIDAKEQGFVPNPGNLNGPGAGQSGSQGGSYGGVGQNNPKPVYGIAALPLELGSPAGYTKDYAGDWTPAGKGGGAIQVLAGGTITIDGLLDADGGEGGYYETSAGSGGSIFLAAMNVRGTGTMRARGRSYYGATTRGCSGGGRIAIWQHFSLEEIERRISERNIRSLSYRETDSSFTGVLDVFAYEPFATPGTKGFYSLAGTIFVVR